MAIDPKAISNIVATTIEKYTWLLKYIVLGPQSITRTQIKFLIKSGLLQPHHIKLTLGDAYLQSHLDNLKRVSRKSVREYTMKHLRTNAGALIDKFMEKQSSDLGGIIQNNVMAHVQAMRDTTRTELSEGVLNNKTAKAIAAAIRDKTQDFGKDWDKVVNTEIARAQNLGSLDAIVENNVGKAHDDIMVYKVGVVDEKLCQHCKRLWHNSDMSPKVYKLSELIANGSNYGKKAADWKPTIDITHPNCRHILVEIPHGFGFKDGGLTYVGKGHDEHKHQKAK